MRADTQQIKQLLKEYNFPEIFREELGWSPLPEKPIGSPYNNQKNAFTPLAQKVGFKVYQYTFSTRIPDEQTLKQIDRPLVNYAAEHLTIFVDAKQENQAWLWIKRVDNQPPVARLNRLNKNQSGELLAQKIARLYVSIDEEESITLTSILDRVNLAFDVEKVTTNFYKQFQEKHAYFLGHIENISDEDDRKWYTSIMLNRLMFVYFLQRKRLLDNTTSSVRLAGELDYLQKRLKAVQNHELGSINFYKFLRLLFEGLNLPPRERDPKLEHIIGKIPYINGGIFDVHTLEQRYSNIQISDKAFEKLFELFEGFDWYLDDRPMRSGNEINPDVLGYIFEKYINQKQMGAYYTKEDITGYISKNTIIPFIFEKVAQLCPDAFMKDGLIWSLLKANPDNYIYEEMAHGLLELLPPEIEAGITDIEQRTTWNRTASEQWALPTETWREVVERRRRYKEVHTKIVEGEISTINDLITYNLNITQFARDVIAACKKPGLLNAFYNAIQQVTVLDPTCGSGAFLFAALNILKPLYQICIERMRQLVKEQASLPATQRKECDHIDEFRRVLKRFDDHRNQEYFILKSIIVNNLYGVDIMEEAIEICKLRLFLKLVAQVTKPDDLEPLPDIDFNVLAGNTLIGFTSMNEIRRVVTTKLLNLGDTEKMLQLIEQDARAIDRDEKNFRSTQTDLNIKIDPIAKQQLRQKLENLRDKLDPYLATEYGIYESKYLDKDTYAKAYAQWKKSHQPFHWWAEFYKIMQDGGFDVIIGNPPYVEWSKIKDYNLLPDAYSTKNCGNLYTVICERAYLLLQSSGQFGMIVPISCVATDRMEALRALWRQKNFETHISHYSGDAHPSVLFQGVKFRLSIVLQQYTDTSSAIYSTHFQRWLAQGRDYLFPLIKYVRIEPTFIRMGLIPKIGNEQHTNILRKLCSEKSILEKDIIRNSDYQVYCHRIIAHFVKAVDFVPFFKNSRDGQKKSEDYKVFPSTSKRGKDTIVALLNSSLFYSWFVAFSDVYHCGREIILNFPCNVDKLMDDHGEELHPIKDRLMQSLQDNSVRRKIPYKTTGLVEYDEFYPRKSKPIIDEIDRVLAQHYGFTPEELDFIINYDIKYRMGKDSGEESEE